MPLVYDLDQEYSALTKAVAIWDVAAERQVTSPTSVPLPRLLCASCCHSSYLIVLLCCLMPIMHIAVSLLLTTPHT